MNFRRWFAWACLALVVIAEVALFRAYRDRDALQTDLNNSQAELRQAAAARDELKNSSAGLQATEISRLRKQNQLLSNQVVQWRASLDEFSFESRSNALHLATARTALRLQQQHLEQLENQNQQILNTSTEVITRKTCLSNLRFIDDAKQQWALDTGKPPATIPKVKELQIYFKDGVLPECPAGGMYSLNALNEVPTCSSPGHALTQ